uniref:Uncharacterized protein n=1 Tax=mine drainage metagenome TaxID=410659 RepID=E6PP51_9ZZZZ
MNWTDNADQSLRAVLENMVAEGLFAQSLGMQVTPAQVVSASHAMLLDLIRVSLPLAQVMDQSDLVLHAQGPALREGALRLGAFNWVVTTAEKALRRLSSNLFDLAQRDAKRLSRGLDLRLTGMAPGSLYIGVKIESVVSALFTVADEPLIVTVRETVHSLPRASSLIGEDRISTAALRDVVPDPAQRDSLLETLLSLTPTGRQDIETVNVGAPGEKSAALSKRARLVLRDYLRRPDLLQRKTGAFVGEVREIDLDAGRFHLRGVQGVGAIRCVATIDHTRAKLMLGETVRIRGDYECDRNGKPRLMLATEIEVIPAPRQAPLLDD